MSAPVLRIRRGQFVRTWFDTGAMGATILYGVVTAAGPRRFTVRWESGLVNHVLQGHPDVLRIAQTEVDPAALERLQERAK